MGTQLPLPPKKGGAPKFLAHVYCDQMAVCIRIPRGTEVGLGLGDIVLDGALAPAPIFGPCLLWPNGWMDEDATWYMGVCLSPGDFALDGDPAPPSSQKGRSP